MTHTNPSSDSERATAAFNQYQSPFIEPSKGHRLTVTVGEKLFAFSCERHWANKAKLWFAKCGVRSCDTVCIDAKGRICTRGIHFMQATRDDAYPVNVYALAGAEKGQG